MNFGLPQKTIIQLKSVFKKYPEVNQVKIYGSRVTDHYRKGSDIDLALFSESEKDLSSNLSWDLDDLPCPYLFDIVNYSTLGDSPLKEEIDKYGRVFYKKTHSSLPQQELISKKQSSKPSFSLVQESSGKISKTDHAFAFKQTEIGEIPENWEVYPLSKFGEVITGTTPRTSVKEYYGNQYKLISPADLNSGKYVTTAHRMLSKEGLDQCKILPKYSVLVGCIGNVGKIGMTLDEKSATNQQINAIVCNKKVSPHFVLYSLYYFKKRLQSAASQTTVPILNKTNFEKFKISCPSLTEQEKIAGILSQIQKTIEIQDKLIETTKELKKSTMKQLFTYGIKGGKTKQTEIGEIPKNWSILTLGNICKPEYGLTDTAKSSGDTRFIRITDIEQSGNIIEENKKFISLSTDNKKYLLKKGDLLVARTGATFGKTAFFDKKYSAIFASYLIRLNLINTDIFPKYYWFFSQSKLYWNQAYNFVAGGTQPQFNSNVIKQIKIPCPSVPEQKKIADILTKMDQKIQTHKKKKSKFKELFKTMLNKLMTGKIRVHGLNINTNLLEQ